MSINARRHVAFALLITTLTLLMLLAFSGYSDRATAKTGLAAVDRVNRAYLETASDKALQAFLTLSVLKVGLAVVEGSQVGVSIGVNANIQAGDVVQSAYDYVNLAWRIVLAGTVILHATGHLLDTAAFLDHRCLGITLALLIVLVTLRWLRPRARHSIAVARDVAVFGALVTVSLYLLLPLSVGGGAYLSRAITQPSVDRASSGLGDIQTQLFPDQPLDGDKSYLASLQNAKERLVEIARFLKTESEDMVRWIVKLIAGYIFDTIVFPLAIFLFLFWSARLLARYVFAVRTQRSFRQDLEALFRRYGKATFADGGSPERSR